MSQESQGHAELLFHVAIDAHNLFLCDEVVDSWFDDEIKFSTHLTIYDLWYRLEHIKLGVESEGITVKFAVVSLSKTA